jgi:hypothetical protein
MEKWERRESSMRSVNLDTMRTGQGRQSTDMGNIHFITDAFCKRPETGNACSQVPITPIALYPPMRSIRLKAESRSSEGNGKSYEQKTIPRLDDKELGKKMP